MSKRSDVAAANRRVLRRSALVVLIMFALGFAMAPFYDAICRALGVGGKTGRIDEAAATTTVDLTRTVTIEFTGHAMAGLPWEFRPLVKKLSVHPGEAATVSYYVRNPTGERMVGQAVPSVTPGTSAVYFNKSECFCFTQQSLEANETREMPVRFVVDAKLPRDIHTITLSYGFFNTDKAQAGRYGGEAVTAHNHDHGAVGKLNRN